MQTIRILALMLAVSGFARAAAPTIDTQPAGSTNCPGTSATFTAAASGDAPLSYQWYFNETNALVDATNTSYTIPSVVAGDAGGYSLVVTNNDGAVTSIVAQLVVNEATTATGPGAAAVCEGGTTTLTTTPAGTGPFSYVWRKDGGAPLSSTSNTLDLVSVTAGDAGTYSVEVTGACNSVTNSAVLTVNTLTAATALTDATNCAGTAVSFSTVASGTGPFTYVWRKDGGAPLSSTSNSLDLASVSVADTGTYSVEVTGACNSVTNSAVLTVNPLPVVSVNSTAICPGDSAVLTATHDAASPTFLWSPGGETTESITNSPGSTTVYTVTVTDGVTGCSAQAQGTITVNSLTSASGPSSVEAPVGKIVTLATVASGTGPFTYVWRKDGGASIGSGSSLTISPVGMADAGTYTVEVTGACNSVTNSAVLSVRAPNLVYVSDNPNTNSFGAVALWAPPVAGSADDTMVSFLQAAGFNVVRFSPNDTNTVLLDPADVAALNTNDIIVVSRAAGSGAWQSPLGSQWNTNITVPLLCQNAYLVRNSRMGWFSGTDAVPDGVPSRLTAVNIYDPTNAYLFGTTTMNGAIMAGNYDFALGLNTSHILPGNNPAAGSKVLATIGTTNVVVAFPAGTLVKGGVEPLAGFRMYFAAGNRENGISIASGAGSNNLTTAGQAVFLRALNLTLNAGVPANLGDAPVLLTGPSNIATCVSLPLTLTASAAGQDPLGFQWYFNDSPLTAGTNATLSFNPFQTTDAGNYYVVVTNGVGSATSEVAVVSISSTGVVASALANQAVCPGTPVTFTTTASGTEPLTYTWYKDGVVIQGPDGNNSYSIPSAVAGDSGLYAVTVANVCNIVSNTATLAVAAPPVVTANPQNATTPMGNGTVFSVTATSSELAAYRWLTNGVELTGATASTLAISNLFLSQNGMQVQAVVSNCAGVVTSAVAVLTVTPISAISFDFNNLGQWTNAPYNLFGNDWMDSAINSGGFNNPLITTVPFESPTGGVGVAGSGALDLAFNNGTDHGMTLLPLTYDFSLTGKTITASIMFKSKAVVNATRRAIQVAFVTTTNINNAWQQVNANAGQGFMSAILQSTVVGIPARFQLRAQHKVVPGTTAIETTPVNSPTNGLDTNRWYRFVATFVNTKASGAASSNFTVQSYVQDMGVDGVTPGATVLGMAPITYGNPDIVSSRNLFLCIRGFEDGGQDYWDNIFVTTASGALVWVQPPTNQTVLQGRHTTLHALVDGDGPYTYQWFKNGVAIPDARNWKYATPQLTLADNGAEFSVTVTSTNNSLSATSVVSVVTDALDVLSAGSVDGSLVGVRFDQPVTQASAETVANYSINGVAPLSAKLRIFNPLNPMQQLRTNQTEVLLVPATAISGSFTVTVVNVTSLSGNPVGANNTVVGEVLGLTALDIDPNATMYNGLLANPAFQIRTIPGSTYSFAPGQIEQSSGGHDIFGNFDGMRLAFKQVTGDFDYIVRIPYMDLYRTPAKAGFNARVSLDPAAPNVGAFVNPQLPGRNFYEGTYRQLFNNGSTSWGTTAAASFPNAWLRFRRVANSFIRYSSVDGITWQCLGVHSPNPEFPATLYVGIAGNCNTGGNVIQGLVTAQYDSLGSGPTYPGATIAITGQPNSQTANAGATVTFGVTNTVTGGGIPAAAGEVFYTWQRTNSTAGGWTNLLSAGGTNNLLTTTALLASDNGALFRVIISAAGASSVTSAVVSVTVNDTALPTVATVFAPTNSAGTFIVRFNEDVSAGTALDTANYRLTNLLNGTVYTINSAAFLGLDRRTVVITTTTPLDSAPRYALGVSGVQDLAGNTIAVTTPIFAVAGANGRSAVVIEYYGGVATAGNLSDLTNHIKYTSRSPDWITYSNSFQVNGGAATFPSSALGDQYGVRMYSYFVAPSNSQYTFWWRADDFAHFFINTNPVNSTSYVGRVGANVMGVNNPNYQPTNRFVTPPLTAGQKYYVELLYKESTGGDGGVVHVEMGTSATAPAATAVSAGYHWAYPDAVAPEPKMITEVYSGLANIGQSGSPLVSGGAYGNGNLNDLFFVTNFQNLIVGNPQIFGAEKYSGYSTNLSNTSLDNYYGRIYAYFVPPTNGNYRFYSRSDDSSVIYMNTNAVNSEDPNGKVLLRSQALYTNATTLWPAPVTVSLVGGQRYFLEGVWREGGGGDGFTMAVRGAGELAPTATITTTYLELIPNSMLHFPTNLDRFGPIGFAHAGTAGGIAPANPTVTDGQSLKFQARGLSGALPYLGFTWTKNGQIQMMNSAFWVTPPLTLADNGAEIVVTVTNLFSSISATTTVTVLPDSTAPTITSAVASQYGDTVVVTFSEDVEFVSANCAANYGISGLTIYSATRDDVEGNRVVLRTSPHAPGTTYTLVVNGVRDMSTGGNPTVLATKNFTAWGYGGLGAVFVEAFYNIQGSSVDNLLTDPKFINNQPDESYYTNVFAVGTFAAHSGREFWGARLSGYFMPPSNGLYRFYIRGDDGTRLYVNTNGPDANGKVALARNDGANSAANGALTPYEAGVALGYVGGSFTPILSLTNGTPYYVEALMKEGGGGDYVVVTMRGIDPGTLQPTVALPGTPAAADAVSGGLFQATGNPDNISLNPPPTEIFVTENDLVTLNVSAVTTPASLASYGGYQWQRTNDGSGTFTNIPGATSGSYSFYAKLGDDLSHYRVIASFPGAIFTPNTLVHVAVDVTPPVLLAASARPPKDGYQMVGIQWSEPVDAGTALEPSNYQAIDEDGTVVNFVSVQFRPGFPSQLLLVADGVSAPDGFLIGDITMYTADMPDLALTPNFAVGPVTTGAVQRLAEQIVGTEGLIGVGGYATNTAGLGFIGVGAGTDAFTYTNGGWDVVANGWDIWNTADGFLLLYREVTGDFDIKTRIESFAGADQWSKAGLMARGSTNSNSRMFFMGTTPTTTPVPGQAANNFFALQYREVDGRAPANISGSPTNPPSYPNAWVRLQRSNAVFYGYWSTNNVDWTLLGSLDTRLNLDGPFPDTLLVGLATVSHDQVAPQLASDATVNYRDLYFPAAASITVQPTPDLVVTGIHQSVTFSGLVAGGGDGPITYQWRKNGVAIPDATNDTYTIANTAVADSGNYTVLVANYGGGAISSNCVLIVTNGIPSVTGENLALDQGSITNIDPAVLLANDSDPEMDPLSITAVSGVLPVTFSTSFETGAASTGTVSFGTTYPLTGGVTNSGYALFNAGAASLSGSIILNELTPNKRVSAFSASFKLKIADWSAEPADGFSFNFAADVPIAQTTPFAAENGGGTGFSFVYDAYRFAPFAAPGTAANAPGGGTANTSGFKIIFGGTNIIGVQTPSWTNATEWVPVTVDVTESGAVTVTVDGTNVFPGLVLPGWTPRTGRLGLYARTGGAFESHGIDDLSFTVRTLDTARGYAVSGASLYGNATISGVIGAVNSGSLHLTEAAVNQVGSFIINELTPGNPVTSFDASFKLRIGNGSGNAADGFSFNFASDLPNAAAGATPAEEGVGTNGLSFAIDNYPTGGPDSPSLKLKTNGVLAGLVLIPKWNNTNFIPVTISLTAGGAVTVNIDGTNVVAGFPTAYTPINGRFGFFARTGGEFETHWVDDISITANTAGPSVTYAENFNSGGPGTVVLTNGFVIYNPVDNACGDDSFYYLVSDGQQDGSVWAQVTVNITPTNGLLPTFVTCPVNRNVSLDTNCQYALPDLTVEAIVSGNCVVVTQSPLAGTLVGSGPTVVTLTATDSQGNFTTCNVTVTAADTTAPVVSCPADITTPQSEAGGAVVTFSASATDNCDGAPTVVAVPASGSLFPPGPTLVTVTSYDVSGNTNTCTFTVTVTPDEVPPVINCPTNITVACNGTNATATYSASATDNVDPSPTVIITPPSGSIFPLGTNTVLVTAYDAAGNTNTCTFQVIVTDPIADTISLSILQSGTNVVLTWPQTCTPYSLQCATNLVHTNTSWSAVGTLPTPVGNSFQLILPATEPQKYFRLLKD